MEVAFFPVTSIQPQQYWLNSRYFNGVVAVQITSTSIKHTVFASSIIPLYRKRSLLFQQKVLCQPASWNAAGLRDWDGWFSGDLHTERHCLAMPGFDAEGGGAREQHMILQCPLSLHSFHFLPAPARRTLCLDSGERAEQRKRFRSHGGQEGRLP